MRTIVARRMTFFGPLLIGFMILQSSAAADSKEIVRVEGSTSMAQMVYRWAHDFMETNPNTTVEVRASGTQVGLQALQERKIDVAMASRQVSSVEKGQFAAKGIRLIETNVGLEGVAVIVNQGNPVEELTLEQLKNILKGTYSSWDNVGGPDEPITFMARKVSTSGTSVFLQEQLLEGAKFTKRAKFLDYYDWVAREIVAAKWGIGVVAFSFADRSKVKILAVRKDEKSPAILPSHETFADGSYPLTRPFLLCTEESCPQPVTKFVEYCKGKSRE